jgi:hypothetical protein
VAVSAVVNYDRVSIPLLPGYFVYRIWSAENVCLYVGKAGGKQGPVPVSERLRRHAREQPWWQPGIWADVCELPDYATMLAEEDAQIKALKPLNNKNGRVCRAGHDTTGQDAMTANGRCRKCRDEYMAAWHEEHPHWAAEHPESVKAAQARFREQVGDEEYLRRMRVYQRDYRARNAR